MQRSIIILTWDARLEETLFTLFGLDIFSKQDSTVLKWDVQLDSRIGLVLDGQHISGRHGRALPKIALKLGIPTKPNPTVHQPTPDDLTHNAAMSATFTLQILLALEHMTEAQYAAALDDQLTPLPPRFSTEPFHTTCELILPSLVLVIPPRSSLLGP